mmetsp:Transcript_42050/g.48770  ORF Transcript_42050/g.48770 Transcript_42050/m.48770 type:complete len:187 (-) Transcript_42050:1656-2216(-)
MYMAGNSELTVSNCTLKLGYSRANGGAIYASSFKQVTIRNCTFTDNSSTNDGSDLYLSSGITQITTTTLTLTPNPTSIYLVGGTFTATSVSMTNSQTSSTSKIVNYFGSAIYASNMDSFSITNANFTSLNYGGYGGAVYLTDSSTTRTAYASSPVYSITSCIFTSNSAYYGGAIYLDYVTYATITS